MTNYDNLEKNGQQHFFISINQTYYFHSVLNANTLKLCFPACIQYCQRSMNMSFHCDQRGDRVAMLRLQMFY